MFRLPSIIPYMVRRQNFSCRSKGFCVFKLSVIVHNRYCVKCSLFYTADYTGTYPKKSCHLLADSSINNLADHDRTG